MSIRGLHWRVNYAFDWFNALLVRLGPRINILARWPWPLRKPFQRSSLVIEAPGGGVGDELMCLPIFEEIKRRNPACRITFAARRPGLFENHPAIDKVIAATGETGGVKLAYHYVIPPPRPLMTLMAECVGLNASFDNIPLSPFPPSAPVKEALDNLSRPIIVIQPLASAWTTNKNWPLESWRALIQDLAIDYTVIEVGTASAFEESSFGVHFGSFAGKTSIEDFAAIISRADLFIGPSSGGMHFANAFRIRAIIIFGGYESPAGYQYPATTALYSPVECAPCWKQTCPYGLKCLHAITPAQVIGEARKILAADR